MTKAQIRDLQGDLNKFTRTYLAGLGKIKVDGDLGPGTKGRIKTAKYYLGYKRPVNDEINHDFWSTLNHPRKASPFNSKARRELAVERRKEGRAKWADNKAHASSASGVSTFDGKPVATWLRPYLVWARAHGWKGTLNSGWRDPVYSESLCRAMCGAPSCPGRCAGRASNHSGSVKPRGALDVSDYWRFGQLMRQCPYSPRIFNALPRDLVHYSASGR
jgi:hypothetical protein